MYAVIKTGGKQYTVTEGDLLKVEKLPHEVGGEVEVGEVLAIKKDDELIVGQPVVDRATVVTEVIGHGKAKKVVVFKKKRRKGYAKKQGHRQQFTTLKIKEINVD